ncbi:hypothetical protein EYV94_07635 [Puteibacter caeruleilacunae]|nr:hypothetical protein EYV94_07635 [Puteibacter caeruleilacunae]
MGMKISINNSGLRLSLFIVSLIFCCTFCKQEKRPEDFAFSACTGLAGKMKVDTYNREYSQQFITETGEVKDTIINFTFSENELDQIYRILVKYDIASYPNPYIPKHEYQILPDDIYSLDYRFNGNRYKVVWDTFTSAQDKKSKRLRAVLDFIFSIVKEDPRVEEIQRTSKQIQSL